MKKSRKIALCGVSTALAGVFVAIGNTISILDYSCYMLASICVALPFLTGEIKWSVLTFIASAVVGVIVSPNILAMVSYILFFAPYIILTCILKMKRAKRNLSLVLKNILYLVSSIVLVIFTEEVIGLPASQEFQEMFNLTREVARIIILPLIILLMNIYDLLMQKVIGGALYQANKLLK